MAEAVGHADGDLEPRARIAQLDGPEDVRSAPPDPLRQFDDLGHA